MPAMNAYERSPRYVGFFFDISVKVRISVLAPCSRIVINRVSIRIVPDDYMLVYRTIAAADIDGGSTGDEFIAEIYRFHIIEYRGIMIGFEKIA